MKQGAWIVIALVVIVVIIGVIVYANTRPPQVPTDGQPVVANGDGGQPADNGGAMPPADAAPTPATGEPIKIGVLAPLTEDLANYGERVGRAVEIALDEANSAGGIDGRRVEVVIEDTKAQPGVGVAAAQKLINIDRVPVIMGAVASGVTLAVAPVCEEAGVVLLTAISSNARISDAGDYIFRIAPSDALQGVVLAQWAQELGYSKAAVLYVNNDYGKGLEEGFCAEFADMGGAVAVSEGVTQGTTDFRAAVSKIISSDAQFLLFPMYTDEAGPALKQMRELGMTLPVIATDTVHFPVVLEVAREAAEGMLLSDVSDPEGEVWERFNDEYNARFGVDADIVAAEAYDAMQIIFRAIELAGTSSYAIKDALYEVKYVGASGDNTFDGRGDATRKSFQRFVVDDGRFMPFEP